MSFMLRQYYWHCVIFIPLTGEARWKKNQQIFVINVANAPCFAYRCSKCAPLSLKAQSLAADYILR
jgi:hypothetical protein